jgi:hypothetical protein
LLCESGICLPPGCTPGVEGCPCDGDADVCLGDLQCDNGLCVPGTGTGGATATTTSESDSDGSTSGSTGDATTNTTDPTTGGTLELFTPCDGDADCPVLGSSCWSVTPGPGFCTAPCVDQGQCAGYTPPAFCVQVNGQGICAPSCDTNDDCLGGLVCVDGTCGV